jgi:hypothetical protein
MTERGPSPFATIPERYAGTADELCRRLSFPVDSKAALAEQLGGTEASLTVGKDTDAVGAWLMFLPAHCFPLASPQNFYEKIGELAAQRNPDARARLDTRRLRIGVDHFFAQRPAADALADTLSAALGTTVEPDRLHEAVGKLVADERAAGAIGEALAGAYQKADLPESSSGR